MMGCAAKESFSESLILALESLSVSICIFEAEDILNSKLSNFFVYFSPL